MSTLSIDTTQHELVAELVARAVPPFPSDEAAEWITDVRALELVAREYLLQALQTGESNEQYAALMALRVLGDDAWADGYGAEITYYVRHKGDLICIRPATHTTGV
jgi:hypothetical protein